MPIDKFIPVVDAELARAKAAMAGGAAPKDVYELLIKDGIGATEPEKATIRLAEKAPATGAANAPVTMHVFSDFQCPFCSRVLPTMAEVKKLYGAKLRVVWRNLPLPFHDKAPLAAEAALEAQAQKGDVAFWKMHDLLFDNQKTSGGLEREALESYARKLGLDAKKFATALDEGTHKKRVEEDKEAANAAGISGTPTFVIVKTGPGASASGYLVSGAQPTSKFKRVIDRALADAKPAGKTP
jgi:protein-disulfide isomerase